MPDAAGGEGGHGAANPDPVIHSSLRGPPSEVGLIEEASAVIKTQQIASTTTTCELSLAYHALIERDP